MGPVTLFFGLLLPWALGIAALLTARDARRPLGAPGELAWLAGAGFLGGALLLTLWMRALSAVGVPFGIAAIALPLLAATLALAYAALRRHGGSAPMVAAARAALRLPDGIGGVTRILWWTLCAWMALRFALLGLEIAARPLYPWDAWIAWATKARVWFELGRIAPFVDAGQWLAGTGTAWFDALPEGPATLPLLQVWACVALGRWDDALMNWPWWQVALALVLMVYGGLRRLGVGALAALIGAYFAASLPLANVHVALAGYADLPLAACYAGAVLALLHWLATRTLRDAVIAALLAAACPLIKATGTIWVVTLLPGIVVAAMPRLGAKVVGAGFGLVLFALAVLAQTNFVVAGRSLHLDFAPAWAELAESYLITGSWNLLWYGALGAAILAWRRIQAPPLLPLATIVAAGMLFVLILFAFPGVRGLVTDPPTVDRATLHLAPLLIVFMLLAFRAFAEHWRAAHPPPEAAEAPAAPAVPAAPAAPATPATPATPEAATAPDASATPRAAD